MSQAASCMFCMWNGYSYTCTGRCMPQTPPFYPVGHAEPVQKGCICPPGSEKTCQRWDCGRKSPNTTVTSATMAKTVRIKEVEEE